MCKDYKFKVNYFEDGEIKADLFSDEAERVVRCFLKKVVPSDGRDKKGNPRKKLSSTQIRKFYEEVLNLKAQLENGASFRKILPYFKMLKAKANVAYQRDVINTNFKIFIEKNVDYVEDNEERFKIFCTFFEAVVAYSKGIFKD